MIFRMLAVLSEFERDQVAERTSMALQHKKACKERISRHIPYGSRLALDGVHLEADESEQRIIALARELHQAKLSSRKIAAKLAKQGFYSRVGTVFTSTAVLAMVAD